MATCLLSWLALQIIGASFVETLRYEKAPWLETCTLGGPATITGYFGGVGNPTTTLSSGWNEFLYYYTNYGRGRY